MINKSKNLLASFILVLVPFVTTSASAAPAAQASKKKAPVTALATEATASEAAATSHEGGKTQLGVGFTTAAGNALSAWLELNEKDSLQVVFSMPSTSPFSFTTGGYFRHTLEGSRNLGFHVGGGLLLGLVPAALGGNAFSVTITPTAGVHFTLPGTDSVLFSLDGGPALSIVDGSANFGVSSYSNLMGLSAHYFF